MDEILSLIVWLVVDVLLVSFGRLAVRLVSLTAWRGEKFGGLEGKTYSAAGSFSFLRNGQRVFTRLGLAFAGTTFCGVLFVVFILVGLPISS